MCAADLLRPTALNRHIIGRPALAEIGPSLVDSSLWSNCARSKSESVGPAPPNFGDPGLQLVDTTLDLAEIDLMLVERNRMLVEHDLT